MQKRCIWAQQRFLPNANGSMSMSTAHSNSGANITVQEPHTLRYLNLAVSTDTVEVGEPFHVSFRVRRKDVNQFGHMGDLSICIVVLDLHLAVERLQLDPKKVVYSRAVSGDYFCSRLRRFPFTTGRRKILVDDVVPKKEGTRVPIIAAHLNSFFVGLFSFQVSSRVLFFLCLLNQKGMFGNPGQHSRLWSMGLHGFNRSHRALSQI